MPIYEYECKNCGKTFEIFQKMGDDPLKVCRVCKGELSKLISNCAFHLKGTGWYVTDYKKPVDGARTSPSSGNGQKSSETKEEKSEAVTPASAAPETKPDTTAETKSENKTT